MYRFPAEQRQVFFRRGRHIFCGSLLRPASAFFRTNFMERILLADIGNTCIKLGLADDSGPEGVGPFRTWSLPTRMPHTRDSLGLALIGLLGREGLGEGDFSACAICSVVPDLTPILRDAVRLYLSCPVLNYPDDFPPGLENRYDQPTQVGADRLLAAFAARTLFPEPASLISVDFGTATTFDCVTGQAYLGGLICPGVLSSHGALASGTAKLPRISLEADADAPLIGSNTSTSMRHGFVFGFAAMTEGLCARLKKQLPGPCLVLGTGGFAPAIAAVSSCIDHVRPDLILEGLRLAWKSGRR